jgi:hypothetical protein
MYGIKVDKYHYFGAAVEQLNEEIKKVFPSYAVSYIWDQATGDCNLQLKVDAVKMLSRGTIVEDDYVLVEADIRKFLTWHFGQSDYFDSHVLTRIDYKQDCYVPDSKDRKLLFHC